MPSLYNCARSIPSHRCFPRLVFFFFCQSAPEEPVALPFHAPKIFSFNRHRLKKVGLVVLTPILMNEGGKKSVLMNLFLSLCS